MEMGSGRNSSNRRRSGRLAETTLSCSIGRILNISAGGMAVTGRAPRGRVAVTFGRGASRTTILAVRVWCRRAGLLRHVAGYRFIDPPPNLLERINTNGITARSMRVI